MINDRNVLEPAEAVIADMRRNLRSWWNCAFTAEPSGNDCFALTGPTGYVFQTDGIFWGVDLCLRYNWAAELLGEDECIKYCSKLKFIVYTHEHGDHCDPVLLKLLAGSGILVIAPEFLNVPYIPEKQLIRISTGNRYDFEGIRITPFISRHYRRGTDNGVPEYGYYAETSKHRVLMPGDIRDYDPTDFTKYQCDWLFAHIWFGDNNAKNLPCQPYTDDLADFVAALNPRHVAYTHLYESSRDIGSIWTFTHAGIAADAVYRRNPNIRSLIPIAGERYIL